MKLWYIDLIEKIIANRKIESYVVNLEKVLIVVFDLQLVT